MGFALEKLGLHQKFNFIFLHGFLGQPNDWFPVIESLKKKRPNCLFHSIDYFSSETLGPQVSFRKWGSNFVQWMNEELDDSPKVLVGYSLGGRLALHALELFPEDFHSAFLISINPGLSQWDERKKRIDQDIQWANRFLTEPWERLIASWNAQPVFAGSKQEPVRLESSFHREILSRALTEWSLGHQNDLRKIIHREQKKLTLIVGDKDVKYMSLAQDLVRECPHMDFRVCKDSSHRVLYDNPEGLASFL